MCWPKFSCILDRYFGTNINLYYPSKLYLNKKCKKGARFASHCCWMTYVLLRPSWSQSKEPPHVARPPIDYVENPHKKKSSSMQANSPIQYAQLKSVLRLVQAAGIVCFGARTQTKSEVHDAVTRASSVIFIESSKLWTSLVGKGSKCTTTSKSTLKLPKTAIITRWQFQATRNAPRLARVRKAYMVCLLTVITGRVRHNATMV